MNLKIQKEFYMKILLNLIIASIVFSTIAISEEDEDLEAKVTKIIGTQGKKLTEKKFAGLNFSVGVSLTVNADSEDRIKDATVVNNIVRVTKENNYVPRVMLEAHYFFKGDKNSFFGDEISGELLSRFSAENKWGIGPFVAIESSAENIINAVALGVMVGFKKNSDQTDTSSWNFGLGVVVDPNVQILGEGLYADQPLPVGETEVRFMEKSQVGVLILSSYNF